MSVQEVGSINDVTWHVPQKRGRKSLHIINYRFHYRTTCINENPDQKAAL